MTLDILADVRAKMTNPVAFLKQAVPAYNAAVETYREKDSAAPATSALESAIRQNVADLLASETDEGISLQASRAWGEELLTEVLGVEGAHAVVLLPFLRQAVTALENEEAWFLFCQKEEAKKEGAEEVVSGDFEEFTEARKMIDTAFEVAKMIGEIEKIPAALFKKNDDDTPDREKLSLRNIPQGLKPAKDGAAAGKRGRKALVSIVSFEVDGQEVPAGTVVPELLAKYLPTVSMAEFTSAFDRIKEETKDEDGGWTRVLRIPGHDVSVTREKK